MAASLSCSLWARRWWPGCIWSPAIRATRSRHWKRWRPAPSRRGARRVVRNVRAMQSRIKLWQGRVEDAVRWMENEPQNEIHFNVLERYCYNTFVRVYMAQQRYDKTAQILMRLRSYANMEKRPWLQMEGDLLESIIRYRTGNPLWKTELTQVLRRAESYHFVRLFCREGAALLPLLQELGCPEGVDEAYWQEVLGKTRTMAEAYPLYLSTNAPAALPGRGAAE